MHLTNLFVEPLWMRVLLYINLVLVDELEVEGTEELSILGHLILLNDPVESVDKLQQFLPILLQRHDNHGEYLLTDLLPLLYRKVWFN